MTTVVWNQARDRQQRYKPRLPPELEPPQLAAAGVEERPSCKVCGYVLHKPGCPAIKPADPVQVEPKIFQVNYSGKLVTFPEPSPKYNFPLVVNIENGQTHDPTGQEFTLAGAKDSVIGPVSTVPERATLDDHIRHIQAHREALHQARAEAELKAAERAALRMYTSAQYEQMRQGLLAQVMQERTIANAAAQLLENGLFEVRNQFIAEHDYAKQLQEEREVRKALERQIAQMRADLQPSYFGSQERAEALTAEMFPDEYARYRGLIGPKVELK